MSVLRRAKLRTPDGTESIEYPLGVEAENVEVANQENLSQRLVRIDEDLEKNEEDIAAVSELAERNRQNIGANEIRIDALERRNASVDKKPYYYNSVADMKADNKLKVGDMVITLGYYEANDGGGAIYNIVDDEYLIDDGGSVHDLDNGLKAKMIIENEINIKQFGALQNIDNTLIIQNIINLKKIVFVPKGTWLCGPLTIISGTKIIGENINYQIQQTGIDTNNSLSILQCNVDCETFLDCSNSAYIDLSICLSSCKNKSDWTNAKQIQQFVKLDKTLYSTFDLMILCINNYGISIKNSWENTFKRLYFRGILSPNTIDIKCIEGINGISQTIFYDIQSEGFGATILDVGDDCLFYHNKINSILTELTPYTPFESSTSTATEFIPLIKIGSGGDNIIDSILINNSHLKGVYNNVIYYYYIFSINNPQRTFGFLVNEILFDGNMTTTLTLLNQIGKCKSSSDYLIIDRIISPSAPIFTNSLESMGYYQINNIYSRNVDIRNYGQNSITKWYRPQNCVHMFLHRQDDNRNDLNNEQAVCKINTNDSETIGSLSVQKGDKIKILYKSNVPINYSIALWQRNRSVATTLTGTLNVQNYYTFAELAEITNNGHFIAKINLQAEQTQEQELGNSYIADIYV